MGYWNDGMLERWILVSSLRISRYRDELIRKARKQETGGQKKEGFLRSGIFVTEQHRAAVVPLNGTMACHGTLAQQSRNQTGRSLHGEEN